MSVNLISLQQAAMLSGKSVQTIRRAIKAKKVQAKRQKTPQGFNYLIDKESLVETFKLEGKVMMEAVEESVVNEEATEATGGKITVEATQALKTIEKQYTEVKDLFLNFNKTMQTLVEHNNQERDNFYRLMKSFQDRVVMLEDNVKTLSEKSNKKWYQFGRR